MPRRFRRLRRRPAILRIVRASRLSLYFLNSATWSPSPRLASSAPLFRQEGASLISRLRLRIYQRTSRWSGGATTGPSGISRSNTSLSSWSRSSRCEALLRDVIRAGESSLTRLAPACARPTCFTSYHLLPGPLWRSSILSWPVSPSGEHALWSARRPRHLCLIAARKANEVSSFFTSKGALRAGVTKLIDRLYHWPGMLSPLALCLEAESSPSNFKYYSRLSLDSDDARLE
ncbi:hypothetical protein F4779DRAFT_21776 [Xylariaceae sp. FL0662B]|nr:hypothetical protein F4779DRAFT_21776 [Xylariaceae sp. FL0662B]